MPALDQIYERNGLNQYTSVGGTSFSYTDGRGNLNSDGSRTFEYDLENRLITVTGTASGQLSYDPLGRLRTITSAGVTTEFLYDGDRLIAEYDPTRAPADQLLRRYVHGPGVDEPLIAYECSNPPGACTTSRNWLIADRQGSIIASMPASGTGGLYRYGPYGEPEGGNWTGQRFRYTGQIALPELRLYHYKARVYDPGLGRFLQTDPVGYEDDLNLYAYVRSDPLNLSDSSGRSIDPGACGRSLPLSGNTCLQASGNSSSSTALPSYSPGTVIEAPAESFESFETAKGHAVDHYGPNARSDVNEAALWIFGQDEEWFLGDIGIGDAHQSVAPTTHRGVPIVDLLRPNDKLAHIHFHMGYDASGFGLFSRDDFLAAQEFASRPGLSERFLGMYMADRSGATYRLTGEAGPERTYLSPIDGLWHTDPTYLGERVQ